MSPLSNCTKNVKIAEKIEIYHIFDFLGIPYFLNGHNSPTRGPIGLNIVSINSSPCAPHFGSIFGIKRNRLLLKSGISKLICRISYPKNKNFAKKKFIYETRPIKYLYTKFQPNPFGATPKSTGRRRRRRRRRRIRRRY
jgi:hypothetical protein